MLLSLCSLELTHGEHASGDKSINRPSAVIAGRRWTKGDSTMIEINGMAHVILTVGDFDKARAFYCELLPFLGMRKVYDGNNFVYHVGGRTALGIQRCAAPHEGERFVQNRVGLHHLCLRARSREDVDKAAGKLRDMGAYIDRGPMERE
jgi:catechol 2,3-dioxygenase-like lactoylglutathione lyase family enzyme